MHVYCCCCSDCINTDTTQLIRTPMGCITQTWDQSFNSSKGRWLEQLPLLIESKRNLCRCCVRNAQMHFTLECFKEVSHYLSEQEDWRDILLKGFCPALMSPALNVMSLISTHVADNECRSGVSAAQLGPGFADSEPAVNSHSTTLNSSAFLWYIPYLVGTACGQRRTAFFHLGLEIICHTGKSGVSALIISRRSSFNLTVSLSFSQGRGGAREYHKEERMEVWGKL